MGAEHSFLVAIFFFQMGSAYWSQAVVWLAAGTLALSGGSALKRGL